MKLLNIATIGASALLLAACADDFDTNDYKVEPSEESAQYEWLNDYGTLKSYINYANVGPLFRLGGAVDAANFSERGLVYALAVSNYDEITFGNHMKHNFVMAEDGSMDFSKIRTAIEVAKGAGIKIFGHTLCWHEQQRGSYLKTLIADREAPAAEEKWNNVLSNSDCEGDDLSNYRMNQGDGQGIIEPNVEVENGNRILVVHTNASPANSYDAQFFVTSDHVFHEGDQIVFKFRAKADIAASPETQAHKAPGGYLHWNMFGNQAITTDWKEFEISKTLEADHDGMQTVAFNLSVTDEANTFYFDDIELSIYEKVGGVEMWVNLTNNPDAESDDLSSFFMNQGDGQGIVEAAITPAGHEGRGFAVKSKDNPTNSYDSQFFIKTTRVFQEGEQYQFHAWVRADHDAAVETQAHKANPGEYLHWKILGDINFTTEWKEVTITGTIDDSQAGMSVIAFNLNKDTSANTYYFDDVEFSYMFKGSSIPLTPEEKEQIIADDMKRWIYGMMEACDGYVTAWDVVNEAIADGGNYGVKYGDDDDTHFYWQNYLGENYVRYAVKYAREAFAEYGGNPDELLLFANDYNLEAAYNNTAKTDGLIRTIRQWEADGVTRIDGIGTQMHVSYEMNPTAQARQEQCVVDMFTKLAASGKLVHVSELDMGIKDENGNTIKTEDLTYEHKMLMSDYYKFIVKKFFEIIPKEQQYGLVQWAATDSPEDSGWRAGEPIGIWDLNYARKPAYAGWCDGLSEGSNL
ncbi:MAG: endo-1,4-beta-xylanase [Muribaculaceae bacterium]|nr:endo-1,4-beta-xylanase [Muribaculaceae bacterium]